MTNVLDVKFSSTGINRLPKNPPIQSLQTGTFTRVCLLLVYVKRDLTR